jgi:hypothetical protein
MHTKNFPTTISFFTLFLLLCFSSNAQNDLEEIKVERRGNKYIYSKNNVVLSFGQIISETSDCREAQNLALKAYRKRSAAVGVGFAGGFCVGFALGHATVKSTRNESVNTKLVLPLLLGGAGLLTASYCFEVSAKKNAKEGVDTFNKFVKQKNNTTFNLGFAPNGICIIINI